MGNDGLSIITDGIMSNIIHVIKQNLIIELT